MNALRMVAYWPLLRWNSARSVGARTDTTWRSMKLIVVSASSSPTRMMSERRAKTAWNGCGLSTVTAASFSCIREAPQRPSPGSSVLVGEGNDVRSGGDRDVLLAVEHVGHRRRLPGLIGLEAPQRLAGRSIGSHERA